MFLINSIYSFILLPILTVIAIQSINTHFYKKIYLHTNFFFANLLLTVLSITFFSNLIQIILFFDKNFFYTNLNIIKQILLILLILNFLYFFSFFKKNLKDISINQNSL